jgi:O-antigen/teichoic acid export membrane protein
VFKKIALHTLAMSSVSVFRILAQFFVIPILSRLLSPEDYGVVAMAMPFILFTMIFTDAGVGQSLIRSVDKEPKVWSTAFWMTLMLGAGLGLLIAIAAPLAAMFFNEPRLMGVILLLSAVVIFQAGATIPEAALRQQHRFGVIAATETAAIAAGIICAVLLALNGFGIWALVVQQLVLYGGRFFLTFWYSPFRPSWVFTAAKMREHLEFGRDVLGANLINFITQSADVFIIGKILGAALLGMYSMAFLFLRLPGRMLMGALQYVIYAHLAPLRDNRDLIRQMYLSLTRLLSIVVIPAMFMMGAAHGPVFELLLSSKWAMAGQIFMMAAPAAALQAVTSLRGTFMMIIGRTDMQLRMNAEFCVLTVGCLLLSVPYGLFWAVIGYNIVVVIYIFRGIGLTSPLLACTHKDYVGSLGITWLVSFACACTYMYLVPTMTGNIFVSLTIAAGFGVLAFALSIALQARALRREFAVLRQVQAARS